MWPGRTTPRYTIWRPQAPGQRPTRSRLAGASRMGSGPQVWQHHRGSRLAAPDQSPGRARCGTFASTHFHTGCSGHRKETCAPATSKRSMLQHILHARHTNRPTSFISADGKSFEIGGRRPVCRLTGQAPAIPRPERRAIPGWPGSRWDAQRDGRMRIRLPGSGPPLPAEAPSCPTGRCPLTFVR